MEEIYLAVFLSQNGDNGSISRNLYVGKNFQLAKSIIERENVSGFNWYIGSIETWINGIRVIDTTIVKSYE